MGMKEIGGEAEVDAENGNAAYDQTWEMKKCLADTVYSTELGFQAGSEVRAEVLELVNQLEALNPTPAPIENPELLDGNWVLMYTAFSELIPLLPAGSTPLLKVKSISQSIDTNNLSINNSTTLSSPFADFSFSASVSFEVRSPSRIEASTDQSVTDLRLPGQFAYVAIAAINILGIIGVMVLRPCRRCRCLERV